MKTEIKEISQCVRELVITVDAKKAMEDYRNVLVNFRKYAAIPGFRKGKAPLSMVESMYGDHARDEFLNSQLEEYYKAALDQEDIHPVSPAEPTNVEWEKRKDLVATFKYEVVPEIEVKKYKEIEVPFEEALLTDEAIMEAIDSIRKENAVLEDSEEPVADGDFVKLTITYLDKEDDHAIEREIEVGQNHFGETLNAEIIDKKIGDEFETSIFSGENAKAVKINIVSIKRKELAEIDDEFAKDMDYENLEAMKKDIASELQKELDKQNTQNKEGSIFDVLMKENPFEVPQSIIKNYSKEMAQPYAEAYKMTVDQIAPAYEKVAEFEIKKHYLINEIMKTETIEITEEDKNDFINIAAENLKLSAEEYKEKYKEIIDSEGYIRQLKEKKLVKLISDSATYVPYPKEEAAEPADEENKENQETN